MRTEGTWRSWIVSCLGDSGNIVWLTGALLSCSNLFFNLLYCVIQPAKLPYFLYLSSKFIRGNAFFLYSLFPLQISLFHVTEAVSPLPLTHFSCLIDLKLISDSALSFRVCVLTYLWLSWLTCFIINIITRPEVCVTGI